MREITGWTALRGVAAIWVVLYHFRFHFNPKLGGSFIEHGYLAVDVFFVLSGAVMYYVYAAQVETGMFSLRSFVIKRFARLYPVHFVTLIIAVVITLGGSMTGIGAPPDYNVGYAALINALMLHGWGVLDGLTLNYPSWSISAEFGAYLLFLPLTIAVLKLPARWAVLVGMALFLAYAFSFEAIVPESWHPRHSGPVLTDLTWRFSILRILPEFVYGLSLARTCLSLKDDAESLAYGAMVIAVVIMAATIAMGADFFFVAASGIFIGAVLICDPCVSFAARWLGLISYSIYMVHGLVEKVFFKIMEKVGHWPDNGVPLWTLLLALIVTILVGAISYYIVEEPGRRWVTKIMFKPSHRPPLQDQPS